MLVNSLKCCTKHIGTSGADFNNLYSVTGGSQWRWYSKEKWGSCCKDVPQTAGRTVEPWPKSDPPAPAWRCECPREPMPYNNDPYRIKVPEIAVPPLPPSNAKDRVEFTGEPAKEACNFAQPWYKNVVPKPLIHNENREKPVRNATYSMVVLPKLGYHGRSKYKYAFHEPWNPLDRVTLIEQAEKDEMEHCKEIAAVERAEKDTCL